MVNEYAYFDKISSASMDYLWEHGWRHFGSYFFRYSSTKQGTKNFNVQPLRIDLETFMPSQSQKRVLKKNCDLKVCFKPAFVNSEVELLFAKHKERFKENIPDSIYTFVSMQPADVPCQCKSLCLYLENRLVGISFLDVGKISTSSVYQCFDTLESKRSLGILMVLLSVKYSKKLGKKYYYPGYAYKENSHYDYKKAFRGLEYFDWQYNWLPLEKNDQVVV